MGKLVTNDAFYRRVMLVLAVTFLIVAIPQIA